MYRYVAKPLVRLQHLYLSHSRTQSIYAIAQTTPFWALLNQGMISQVIKSLPLLPLHPLPTSIHPTIMQRQKRASSSQFRCEQLFCAVAQT
ncbi:hypothetical protein BZZ01_10655 [Nostocales cyanobacterium HT-58-2]|nr:hypothetical protein BZZ01_10655 [Nostocales cyanobacterium HT-58-2]